MVSVLEHAGVFTAGLIGLCALACGLMQLSVSRWWRGPPSNAAGRVVNGPPLLQADYEQQTQQQQQQQQKQAHRSKRSSSSSNSMASSHNCYSQRQLQALSDDRLW